MPGRIVDAALLALLGAALPLAGLGIGADLASASSFPGRNGLIVVVKDWYVGGIPAGTRLFAVASDGSNGHWFSRDRHRPSGLPGGACQCRGFAGRWSPDGKRMLFTHLDRLWIADERDLQQNEVVSAGCDISRTDWSPDGSELVGIGDGSSTTEAIEICRLDGYELRPIRRVFYGRNVSLDATPVWSPGAPEVAFVRAASGETGAGHDQLLVVSADGHRRRAIATAASLLGLTWSPDGRRLAFLRCDAGAGTSLSVVDRNGSGLKKIVQLTKRKCIAGDTAWSPDGTRIAFVAGAGSGKGTLKIVAASGGRPNAILRNVDIAPFVSWQPRRP